MGVRLLERRETISTRAGASPAPTLYEGCVLFPCTDATTGVGACTSTRAGASPTPTLYGCGSRFEAGDESRLCAPWNTIPLAGVFANKVLKEDPASPVVEDDLARRWFALPLDILLPLTNGDACQLLYMGRPGGPQGPDVRDAVLRFACGGGVEQQGEHTVGDVEFHVRAS